MSETIRGSSQLKGDPFVFPAGEIDSNGKADFAGVFRVHSNEDFVTGSGVEITFSNPIGYITAYDRSAAAYRQLNIRGIPVTFPQGDVYTTAWTDYSASSTVTGWSSFTSKFIYYKKIGKLVFVQFRITGTSDSTATSFTLPNSVGNYTRPSAIIRAADNGAYTAAGLAEMPENGNIVFCYPLAAGGNWTASGNKNIMGQLFYETT
jgi:hypothetical protein